VYNDERSVGTIIKVSDWMRTPWEAACRRWRQFSQRYVASGNASPASRLPQSVGAARRVYNDALRPIGSVHL